MIRQRLGAMVRLADSITGRTFLILTVGVTTAAALSLTLAIQSRRHEFEAMRQAEVATRAQQLKARWEAVARGEAPASSLDTILGVRLLDATPPYARDARAEALMAATLGPASDPKAGAAPLQTCLPPDIAASDLGPATGQDRFDLRVECWVLSFRADDGARVRAAMFAPPYVTAVPSASTPLFIITLLLSSALMSLLVARLVTRPLRRLSEAADAFSHALDAPEGEVRGPREVRSALTTFNIMRARVREGLLSRTQLLASISHDLQTPLTRMRLRLEHVRDRELREKLIADIQVMQHLVREGLELARSHETQEPWSLVNIDSLIDSLAEDAVEVGADVRVLTTCSATIEVRPNALGRALSNLIDNAVKYGHLAELICRVEAGAVIVEVHDRGPGLPDPDDPRLFEPFYRGGGPDQPKGHGVGLAIARAQAELSGATIRLRNRPVGGLIAELRITARPPGGGAG